MKRQPSKTWKGKRSWMLPVMVMLSGLVGCNRTGDPSAAVDKESNAYKFMHSADIQPLKSAIPGMSNNVDVATGKPFSAVVHAPAPTLSRPVAVSSDVALDDPNGQNDAGEKAGSWVGTLDIYWKLNWIRQELLMGNVPRLLPDVVARQRRHITRILHESKHLAPDPGHYIPTGVTIEQALRYADEALKQLEAGLEHMRQKNILDDAGIRSLSVPWNASAEEITRQFERQGILRPEHAAASASSGQNDEENSVSGSSLSTRRLTAPQTTPPTRQEEAASLALKYAREYHASPEDMARREFEGALRSIVRFRDLLQYEYHKPSVPGSNTSIPAMLHQEPGSFTPSTPTTPTKSWNDPFRKPGDTSPTVVDPFHSSNDPHLLR